MKEDAITTYTFCC